MRIAIYGGGGGVGSSAAFNLLLGADSDSEVIVVDSRPAMVESHVLDLEQVLELGGSGVVRGGNTDDVWGADVVVFTAAAPLTVNTSRLDYLAANAAIAGDLVEILGSDGSWPGALVVVTNPVDPICTWIQRSTGIDRTRVLGYTLNDSLRLRTGVAKALRIAPGTVDAWVLGEHGDACVPLFDRILVAGEPVALTDEQRAQAEEFFRTWYVRHVALDSGRSSTWTSGSGIARMVRALTAGSGETWPASVVLDGEYGVTGVALTVPVALGRREARVLEWPLTDVQQEALRRSAEVVRSATAQIDSAVLPQTRSRPT
jgi:malate/lactate dehydrogenase